MEDIGVSMKTGAFLVVGNEVAGVESDPGLPAVDGEHFEITLVGFSGLHRCHLVVWVLRIAVGGCRRIGAETTMDHRGHGSNGSPRNREKAGLRRADGVLT